jgi:hypothetical protein
VKNNASPKSKPVEWSIKKGFPEATELFAENINVNQRMFTFNPCSEVEERTGISFYDGRGSTDNICLSLVALSYVNQLIKYLSTNINICDDSVDHLIDTINRSPIKGEAC